MARDEIPCATASLGLHLATCAAPAEHGQAIRDLEQLLELYTRGALALADTVRIAGRTTTVGRHLVAACLPPSMTDVSDAPWDAARGARAIDRIVREYHVEIAARCAMALDQLGLYVAERSGLSLAADDFMPPREARAAIEEARTRALELEQMYTDGLITDSERFNRDVDTWSHAAELARLEARRQAPERDPLAVCAASLPESPRPDAIRSPRGTIYVGPGWATGMTGTLGGGLDGHEYFVRATEARHGLLTTSERRWLAYELARDIDAVIGDLAIVAVDCGTARGMRVRAFEYEGYVPGSLAARIEGCVAAEDVHDRDGTLLAATGTLLVPALARRIEEGHVTSVVVRDVRSCEAEDGVCARCFGLAPEDALWTCIGDGVGARAAAAIGAAVGRLARRRIFHIC